VVLMAWLMTLGRWLRLAPVESFDAPAHVQKAPAATIYVATLRPVPLAPIHAPPPDRGRWTPVQRPSQGRPARPASRHQSPAGRSVRFSAPSRASGVPARNR